MKLYDNEFFDRYDHKRYYSACAVVPLLLKLVKPGSVVDVGCGSGMWLKAFEANGISDLLGIDGDWVKHRPDNFFCADLNKPLVLSRKFDLALSLEVAEHLSNADALIQSLSNAAPIILFSAAIPGQGGINHINEQWQDHWVDQFRNEGFLAADVIRPLMWNLRDVSFWYRQNLILFARPNHALSVLATHDWSLNRIHPELWDLTRFSRSDDTRSGVASSIRTTYAEIKSVIKAALGM